MVQNKLAANVGHVARFSHRLFRERANENGRSHRRAESVHFEMVRRTRLGMEQNEINQTAHEPAAEVGEIEEQNSARSEHNQRDCLFQSIRVAQRYRFVLRRYGPVSFERGHANYERRASNIFRPLEQLSGRKVDD